jgi:hypothetical protein
MQAKALATEESQNKFAAVADIAKRNACNSGNFSPAHKLVAEGMKTALYTAYNTTGVYINYRKGFVAVKVAAPATVNDRALLAQKEAAWEAIGFTKVKTAQGIIYRLPL